MTPATLLPQHLWAICSMVSMETRWPLADVGGLCRDGCGVWWAIVCRCSMNWQPFTYLGLENTIYNVVVLRNCLFCTYVVILQMRCMTLGHKSHFMEAKRNAWWWWWFHYSSTKKWLTEPSSTMFHNEPEVVSSTPIILVNLKQTL